MREASLVEVTRGANKFVAFNRLTKEVVAEMTQRQFRALAEPGAGAPPGVSQKDWESNAVVACGVADYGNGVLGRLRHGEFCELIDRYEIGVQRKGRLGTVVVVKEKITADRSRGLTLTKREQDAFPTYVLSVENGILRTED